MKQRTLPTPRKIYFQNRPEWLRETWSKQSVKPYDNLVINSGAENGIGQDLGKTSFDEWQAEAGTGIFYKSGDSIKELRNRNYPQDFAVIRGLEWNIKNRYDLSDHREKELLNLLDEGFDANTVKKLLPDDGEKFDNQIPVDSKGNLTKPLATVHNLIQHEQLREALDYIVWEENPHKPFESNLTMGRQEIRELRESFDLPDELADTFRREMNNLWKEILLAEREAKRHGINRNSREQIRYKIQQEGEPDRNFIHRVEQIGWKFHTNVFQQVLNWLTRFGTLTGKILEAIKKDEMEKARDLRKFKKNLRNLAELHGKDRITINWELKNGNLKWGESPWERKSAIATGWTQAIETLYQAKADVCVNYAEATESLIKNTVPRHTSFSVEAEESKANLTALKHEKDGGSFAKNQLKKTKKKLQRAKNILKTYQEQGDEVGVVTYKEFTDFFDDEFPAVYFGNHKGSNKLEDCDVVAVVGTPNLPNYGLELQHLKFFGEFSAFSKYGYQYEDSKEEKLYFPKKDDNGNEILKTGFSLEGFHDPRMNLIFKHLVLKELRDASQRLRNQRSEEGKNKHLLIFGYCPDLIWENYKEDRRKRTDTVSFMAERLGDVAEAEGEVPETIQQLPDLPTTRLPDNLWFDGEKIIKKKEEQHKQEEIRDYLRKNGERHEDGDSGKIECDWKEVREEVSGTNEDIKEAIEESDINFGRWGRKRTVYMDW